MDPIHNTIQEKIAFFESGAASQVNAPTAYSPLLYLPRCFSIPHPYIYEDHSTPPQPIAPLPPTPRLSPFPPRFPHAPPPPFPQVFPRFPQFSLVSPRLSRLPRCPLLLGTKHSLAKVNLEACYGCFAKTARSILPGIVPGVTTCIGNKYAEMAHKDSNNQVGSKRKAR